MAADFLPDLLVDRRIPRDLGLDVRAWVIMHGLGPDLRPEVEAHEHADLVASALVEELVVLQIGDGAALIRRVPRILRRSDRTVVLHRQEATRHAVHPDRVDVQGLLDHAEIIAAGHQ